MDNTTDPDERRGLIDDARTRVSHQIEILESKAARLAMMIEEARIRGRHLDAHLAELDGGPAPHPDRQTMAADDADHADEGRDAR